MTQQILQFLGGLGIFLLGLVIMTDGLKGLAGAALQGALTRFTRSPVSGACTGAVSTAILQSSSATIVAVVGFVGAGLMTFPQALGVILGANVGTTITGWLVALLGFKLKLGEVVLPFVLIGVLMHLFGRRRWSPGGLALAGFGLIFVGISAMQAGMTGLEGRITPDSFPGDGWVGRLQLLVIGIGITLITQSSSAGVATAITAVYTGTVTFEQAAALVIGMDIGTTATALIATVGGATETRRTGYSHVVYNLITGLGAFLLLSPYVLLWQWWAPGQIYAHAEIALVAFHTGFNMLGMLLILPFSTQLAALICRLVPEKTSRPGRHLDSRLLKEPGVALEAVRTTLEAIYIQQLAYAYHVMTESDVEEEDELESLAEALDETQRYLDYIHLTPESPREWRLLVACMHSLEHMRRLQVRLGDTASARAWQHWPVLQPAGACLSATLQALENVGREGNWLAASGQAEVLANERNAQAMHLRDDIMAAVAAGREDINQGNSQLQAARWMRRVAEHLWRISHHLSLVDLASFKETLPVKAAL